MHYAYLNFKKTINYLLSNTYSNIFLKFYLKLLTKKKMTFKGTNKNVFSIKNSLYPKTFT